MGATFIILVLAVHLLAVNIASAGPLVAAWLAGGGEGPRGTLAQRLARQSLAALALGVVLGCGLLAAPNAGLRAALARFPATAYWFAGAELAFSAGCMAALLWALGAGGRRRRLVLAWGLALASTSNLLYHFPPLMAVIGKLAADPRWTTAEQIPRVDLVRLSARPEVLALWVHFTLASLAAAAIIAMWPKRGEAEASESNGVFRRLAGVALAASLVQLPVGLWLLLTSGDAERNAMLGETVAASASLLAGVAAALGLLQSLAAVTMGDAAPAMRRRSGVLLAIVAVLMTATLTTSRKAAMTRISGVASAAASR